MFKKLLELRQQKAATVAEMRSLMETADKENRSLNADEAGKFDALKAKVEELKVEIERLESVTEEERSNAANHSEKAVKQAGNEELRHWIKTGELRSLATNTNTPV